jgi:hypothetical protein
MLAGLEKANEKMYNTSFSSIHNLFSITQLTLFGKMTEKLI